jgi:hypothetical protein
VKNIFLTLYIAYFLCSCANIKPYNPPNRIEAKYSPLITKYDLDIDTHRCLFAPNYHIDKVIELVPVDGNWHHVILHSNGKYLIDGVSPKENRIDFYKVYGKSLDEAECLAVYEEHKNKVHNHNIT